MEILNQSDASRIHLVLKGDRLAGEATEVLDRVIKTDLEKSVRDVVLSMHEVQGIDSAAVGTLLYLIQTARRHRKRIVLEGPGERVRALLKTLLLEPYLTYA